MLATDLSLKCAGPLYNGMYTTAIILCFIFPIGVPALFMTVLWSHRDLITSRDPAKPCPQQLKHVAFLFKYYSRDAWAWEVIECVRRLLLSSVIILMGNTPGARATWGAFLSIFFSVACGECQPCEDELTQAFAFSSYWLVTWHFLLAVVLAADFGMFSPSVVGVLFVFATVATLAGGLVHWRKIKFAMQAKSRHISDAQAATAQPAILICDPGSGAGSELCLVILRVLRDLGHLDVKGVIANLHPQAERARFLRGTLDTLGMHDVPVGVGTNGGSRSGSRKHEELRFFEGAQQYVPDEGSVRARSIITGRSLLQNTFEQASNNSMTLILLSSLKVSPSYQKK